MIWMTRHIQMRSGTAPFAARAILTIDSVQSKSVGGRLDRDLTDVLDRKFLKIPVTATFGILAALLVIFGWVYWPHQDVAGSLLSAGLAIELGSQFETYNAFFPPVEKAWNILAVRLGQLTGIGATMALVLLTYLACVVSAALAYRVRSHVTETNAMFYVIPLLAFVFAPVFYKNIFGLREQLVVLGLWPYLVLRVSTDSARNIPRSLRLAVALWLGAMLLFKYFYSIVVFLVELADAVAQRRFGLLFRIENLIAAAIVFVYLFLWLGIDPDQRDAMLSVRSAIGANIASVEANVQRVAQAVSAALAICLLMYRFLGLGRVSALGLAAVIGASLVAWLQLRWYTHHVFPIIMAFVLLWWIAGARLPRWTHAAAAVATVVALYGEFQNTAFYQRDADAVAAVLEAERIDLRGQRLGLLNQHPSPFSQVITARGGIRWSPYSNIAYVSAALKPLDVPEARGTTAPPVTLTNPGHQLLHGRLIALWQDMPPDALILDTSFQWPLRYLHFEWEDVFAQDRQFLDILSNYTAEFTYEGQDLAFTYYTRNVD